MSSYIIIFKTGKLVVFYKIHLTVSRPNINNINHYEEEEDEDEMVDGEMIVDEMEHVVMRRFSQFLKIHGMLGKK